MKGFLAVLTCLALAGGIPAQKADERKIAELEKKVAAMEARFGESNEALRGLYRTVDSELVAHLRSDNAARLHADLVRVLEPALKEPRELAGKPSAQNRQKAQAQAKKSVPEALARTEISPLPKISECLSGRFLALLQEAQNPSDILSQTNDDLAKQILAPLLDETIPYYQRWNTFLSEPLKPAEAFRKAKKDLEQARTDLAVAKDPLLQWQIGAPEGYARVPSGNYNIAFTAGFAGSGVRKKDKSHTLPRDIYIALYEVTHQEYFQWIKTLPPEEVKMHLPREGEKPIWPIDETTGIHAPTAELLRHPVVGITFTSAVAYASTQGARLPTEEEWASAAAGPENRTYVWGGSYEVERCNDREAKIGGLRPVGSYPLGRGPFGHFDLAGNCSELVATYDSGKSVDPTKVDSTQNIVARGGSFKTSKKDIVVGWVWFHRAATDRELDLGFRLCVDKDSTKR